MRSAVCIYYEKHQFIVREFERAFVYLIRSEKNRLLLPQNDIMVSLYYHKMVVPS